MISFIVIGKNIAFTVEKCISSIYRAILEMKVKEFEIIYIDSKSSDQTIKLLEQFKKIKKYVITGNCNAAIARNIGAKEAKGESLFFLDGDMELHGDFLNAIYDENFKLKYRYVSGDLQNIFYDQDNNFLKESPYFKERLREDRIEYTTGGFFVIEKLLWEEVNGMRSCFRRGQDLDLGLRLAKRGEFLLRKKELLANHHTISYFNERRFIKMFCGGDFLYPGVLLRKNFFNLYTWRIFKKTQSSALILVFLGVISFFISHFFLYAYPILVFIRSMLKKDKQDKSVLFHFLSFILIDLTVLCGFLFFYPQSKRLVYNPI